MNTNRRLVSVGGEEGDGVGEAGGGGRESNDDGGRRRGRASGGAGGGGAAGHDAELAGGEARGRGRVEQYRFGKLCIFRHS